MEIPEGEIVTSEIRKTKVCKIEKALYNLKISPKKWNERFSGVTKTLGMINDDHDSCLYTWRYGDKLAILILHVDDMLLSSNDSAKLLEIKTKLMQTFEMTDLGKPKEFLGLEIKRDRKMRKLSITQEKYIKRLLIRFDFDKETP